MCNQGPWAGLLPTAHLPPAAVSVLGSGEVSWSGPMLLVSMVPAAFCLSSSLLEPLEATSEVLLVTHMFHAQGDAVLTAEQRRFNSQRGQKVRVWPLQP